jgi:hypothetical protein
MSLAIFTDINDEDILKNINEKINLGKEGNKRIIILGKDKIDQCSYCQKAYKVKTLKVCSKCGQVKYCDKECQLNDWKKHKLECGKIKPNNTKSKFFIE